MDSLLVCGECKSKFDLDRKLAKILPCSCTLCLSCLLEKKNEFDEYQFDCNSCKKNHYLSNLNSILTSQIITHLLENSNNNDNKLLKRFSEKLVQKINDQKSYTSKYYESVLADIDNRSQSLIEVSHFLNKKLLQKFVT